MGSDDSQLSFALAEYETPLNFSEDLPETPRRRAFVIWTKYFKSGNVTELRPTANQEQIITRVVTE